MFQVSSICYEAVFRSKGGKPGNRQTHDYLLRMPTIGFSLT